MGRGQYRCCQSRWTSSVSRCAGGLVVVVNAVDLPPRYRGSTTEGAALGFSAKRYRLGEGPGAILLHSAIDRSLSTLRGSHRQMSRCRAIGEYEALFSPSMVGEVQIILGFHRYGAAARPQADCLCLGRSRPAPPSHAHCCSGGARYSLRVPCFKGLPRSRS
jgi:hypothetical protein